MKKQIIKKILLTPLVFLFATLAVMFQSKYNSEDGKLHNWFYYFNSLLKQLWSNDDNMGLG